MASLADITPEEMKVFLQEAESLLELLDEQIVRLEQEADDPSILQEIFRVAHTLKGSSGMLGFEEMSSLTHAMEELLDGVRKGLLQVTPELVDALLASLDGLKELKDALAEGVKPTLEVAPIIESLRRAGEAGAAPATQAAAGPASLAAAVGETEAQLRLTAAQERGDALHTLLCRLDPEGEWAAVRCLQLLNEIDGLGEVIASVPTQSAIEAEEVGLTLELLVASDAPLEKLREAAASVMDVTEVEISPWQAAAIVPEAPVVADAAPAGPAAGRAAEGPRVESLQSTVRIDVEQLDALMNVVGELVIDRTRVSQISRALHSRFKDDEQVRALVDTAQHIQKVVDELHQRMMEVRMLPVGLLFSKFPRLVRDLARASGKEVRLTLDGEETELDRAVIEKMKDPLVHLIRNLLDHGIETPDDREAAGKPRVATVHLQAAQEQGLIVITVGDDGRGIDREAVRASAVKRGTLTADAAERLSDQESLDLIFLPGLSTAKKTTEISGRGVGMDIVRRDIEELSGRVEVSSTPGEGTFFTLRLPLTLATFRGLLLSCAGTMYAVPLTLVQETLRVEPGVVRYVSGRPVLHLRGTSMSLIGLDEAVRARKVTERSHDYADCYVVVVRASESESDRPLALVVDELVDQQEVVVKTLSGYLGRARGLAGASILGDGRVVLIVDVPTIIKNTLAGSVDAVESERIAA